MIRWEIPPGPPYIKGGEVNAVKVGDFSGKTRLVSDFSALGIDFGFRLLHSGLQLVVPELTIFDVLHKPVFDHRFGGPEAFLLLGGGGVNCAAGFDEFFR